jgi:predicted DNA-binding transcriptional regulator AlpA
MSNTESIIRVQTVLNRTGLCLSRLYRMIAEGTFPLQAKIRVHSTGSELSKSFCDRVAQNGDRIKKNLIASLVLNLLIALWKYATAAVVIEGLSIATGQPSATLRK